MQLLFEEKKSSQQNLLCFTQLLVFNGVATTTMIFVRESTCIEEKCYIPMVPISQVQPDRRTRQSGDN